MRGQCGFAQRRDLRGEHDLAGKYAQILKRHRKADAHAFEHGFAVPQFALCANLQLSGREQRAFQNASEHHAAAEYHGNRRGDRRARHAPAEARQRKRKAQQRNPARRENQEQIQNDVDQIHAEIDQHRRARVARGPQRASENHRKRPEQHRRAHDRVIQIALPANFSVGVQPAGQKRRDQFRCQRENRAADQRHPDGLHRRAARFVLVLFAHHFCDARQHAHAQRPDRRIGQPGDRRGQPDCGRRLHAESPDHG